MNRPYDEQQPASGSAAPSTYTRSAMETGTLGSGRQLSLEAVSAEAEQAINAAAERLRLLAASVRQAPPAARADPASIDAGQAGDPTSAAAAPAPARELLQRLEVAQQELRRTARHVHGGALVRATTPAPGAAPPTAASEATSPARSAQTDPAIAAAVLEGQEQERSRLAEELHDGTAQALANVIFQTEIVNHAIRQDPATAQVELASLRQMLQRELDSLRAYMSQLRPPLTEREGLEETLRESASQLTEDTGVPVDLQLDASAEELDETARAVALRVAQEALRNVGKHAGASRAWLQTRRGPPLDDGTRAWVLEVRDDGRGFDVEEAQAHPDRRHFGLRFMRERAQLLGAELSIEAMPSVGTIVRLSINPGGQRS